MAIHQNSSVDTTKLILGNCKIETAAYASTAGTFTWVNMGAGMVTNVAYVPVKYAVQSGNAPDPIEGIASETLTIAAELIEYDGSVMSAISCGAITGSSTGTVYTVIGGGNQSLTARAFRLTNTRYIVGVTKQTILTTYLATMDAGLAFNLKSDNDADPIAIIPIAITSKPDSTRTAGTQLFTITQTFP
jgi:hypothetical protein